MNPDLTLYDLAGADTSLRFSPHCWKIHMALAHKAVGRHGAVAFHGQGRDRVLRPEAGAGAAARRPGGQRFWRIACHLEDAFPDRPSLFGGEAGRKLSLFVNSWSDATLVPILARLLLPSIHALIHEKDRDYFRVTREKRFGPLEELPAGYAAQIEALRAALQPLRLTLARQPRPATRRPMLTTRCSGCSWARCTSAQELLAPDDAVHAWRERLLDAHGGGPRRAGGLHSGLNASRPIPHRPAQVLSRYPVLKIQRTQTGHSARKASVMPALTPTLTSATP